MGTTVINCLPGTLCSVIKIVIGYLNVILYLLMALAVVFFVWYVIQYFIKPNEKRGEGVNYILYAVIGFFVILSIWGIVNIVMNSFGLRNSTSAAPTWTEFRNIFPR